MSARTEAGIYDEFKAFCKANEAHCSFFKVHGGAYQRPGVSDFIGHWYGFFVALEIKTPGRLPQITTKPELSPLAIMSLFNMRSLDNFKPRDRKEHNQKSYIEEVIRTGGNGGVFDNMDDIRLYLECVLRVGTGAY